MPRRTGQTGRYEDLAIRDLIKKKLDQLAPDIIADLLAAEAIPANAVDALDVQRLSPPKPTSVVQTSTTPAPPSTIDIYDVIRFSGGGYL